jgi:hypothetical protein
MKINQYLKNKNIIIALIITLLLFGGVLIRIKTSQQKKVKEETKKQEVLPEAEIIPTIDSSVAVNLTSKDKKEAILTIKNLPKGTLTIEYELSYLASGNLPKGVVGTIAVEGKDMVERKITLGTCSSGTCVYDTGIKSIKVNLRFEGEYGGRLFEKEFEI